MQEAQHEQQIQQEENGAGLRRNTLITTSGLGLCGTAIGLASNGPTGLFIGVLVTGSLLTLETHANPKEYVAIAKGARALARIVRRHAPKALPQPKDVTQVDSIAETEPLPPTRTYGAKVLRPVQEDAMGTPVLTSRAFDFEAEEDDLIAPRRKPQVPFKFSRVLESFRPSLDRIYLATLETGEMLFCRAEDLCHVALAGSTRGGKSSIMRMLMAQLCAAGAKVLILNPHYSRYILDKKEDWTPFEPYLLHDPMECRKYDVIEYYLRQVATDILPRRLDKFAHSQPVGKPYFLALDELPAIMKHVPDASSYLEDILREGAKVGIFLITAAQDFLVKTISPNGSGGAVRECYRSAYYVGGDATTAKILLDMPANQIEEDRLGRGTIMIRNWVVQKRSTLAYVPLVDNEALYRLLGPSTYVPAAQGDTREQEDDLMTYMVSGSRYEQEESTASMRSGRREMSDPMQRKRAREQRLNGQRHAIVPKTPIAETRKNEQDSVALRQDEQQVLEAYRAGYKTGNAIAGITRVPGTRVNQILNKLGPQMGLIDWKPRVRI